MKNLRISWIVTGIIVLVILFGLFLDMWRTYTVRKQLEHDVKAVTQDAAQYLPYRPAAAVEAGLRGLEQRGIKPDLASVTVDKDGNSLDIMATSEVAAYFAWIVGSPTLPFAASAHAEVVVAGGGPVASMPAKEVAFAIEEYDDFKLGQQILIWPGAAANLPDYAIAAYTPGGKDPLAVGEAVSATPISNLADYASKGLRNVVILSQLDKAAGRAVIRGFATIELQGIDEGNRLSGRFIKRRIAGTPARVLPADNDFGLWQGGTLDIKVTMK